MRFPPATDGEFEAYLRYQKAELLALPLVPMAVRLGGRRIAVPQELRVEIAEADDFVHTILPALQQWLLGDWGSEYWAAGGDFTLCP